MTDISKKPRRASTTQKARRSESYLRDIAAISIQFDNGDVGTFQLHDEMRIPSDPVALLREARRAPDRLAFWLYQAAMALGRMKEAERLYEKAYAKADLLQRHSMADIADQYGNYTERVIKSLVEETDYPDVKADAVTKRKEYVEAQKQHAVLRAIATAMDHRSHTIRALIKKYDAE